MTQNPTLWYVPKGIKSQDSNRYWYTHVHSNIIHNGQTADAAQVSTDMMNGQTRYTMYTERTTTQL